MRAAVLQFFSSKTFAVAGASSNRSKYGHKVFAWYLDHGLPVTPINPSCASVAALGGEHETARGPLDLENAGSVGLSVVTPPHVTLRVLQEAREVGIQAVFLQPGSFDAECTRYAKHHFAAAVAGFEDIAELGLPIGEGWCVLLHGEWALSEVKRREGVGSETADPAPRIGKTISHS